MTNGNWTREICGGIIGWSLTATYYESGFMMMVVTALLFPIFYRLGQLHEEHLKRKADERKKQ